MKTPLVLIFSILFLIITQTSCPHGPVSVLVKVVFKEASKTEIVPAANVEVVLWDRTTNKTTTGETDLNGNVMFTFDSQPSELQYQITLKNKHLSFTDTNDCNAQPFFIQGSVDLDQSNQVEEVLIDNLQIAKAWLYLNQASYTANVDFATIDSDMFPVKACSGEANFFSQRNKTITINLSKSLSFLDDKLYHEFGHAVMLAAVGNTYSAPDCKIHEIGKPSNPTCAWVEGWADFYAVHVKFYTRSNPEPRFQGNDIEKYKSNVTENDGYKDEGRVAAALWDLRDGHDDWYSQYGKEYGFRCGEDKNAAFPVPVKTMLKSMAFLSHENTARTFYKKLLPNLDESTNEREWAESIYEYNWIAKDPICD